MVNDSASSVVHAHTHIVNHNYLDENKIIKELKFKNVQDIKNICNDERSYVYYISPNGLQYITYDYEPISQLMRIYIAKDLGIEGLYNWKKDLMEDNIEKTINRIKKELV